jgi:predicted phosphodiesterase
MRKWIKGIVFMLLLAGGAVICAIRWQAWFSMPPEPAWTGDTIDYVFPYPTEGNTVLVLGDIHNRLMQADYDTLAARVPEADAVAQVGDWMERGQEYYRQELLREWTHSALMGLPVIACPGNHEYSKGIRKTISPIWERTFDHPHNGPVGVPGVSYFVDLPQIRFIVIDTNPLVRLVDMTRTLTWLRQAMNSAEGRFIVVMMHHPVLSVGKGRYNPLIYTAFRHALGEADLVIAGHDHSYMRRTPFVVLNTAGKPKTQQPVYVPEVTDTVPVYGVLRIANRQSQISNLQFNVYRLDDNTLIDSLYVKHD